LTQAASVAASVGLRSATCGAVSRADRIGAALLVGSDAGSPDGETQPIAPRNDSALQPAAGEVVPWHFVQFAARIDATS